METKLGRNVANICQQTMFFVICNEYPYFNYGGSGRQCLAKKPETSIYVCCFGIENICHRSLCLRMTMHPGANNDLLHAGAASVQLVF